MYIECLASIWVKFILNLYCSIWVKYFYCTYTIQEKDLILKWTMVATSISSSSSLHSLNPSVVHCLISHTRVATSYIHFNQSSSSNQPYSSVVHCLISNSWWCFGGVFLGMASLQVHRQQDQHLDLLRQDILETVHLIICPRIRGNLKQL